MRTSEWLPLVLGVVLLAVWLGARAGAPPRAHVASTVVATVATMLAVPANTGPRHPTLASCYYRQLERATPESRAELGAMLAVAEPPDAEWNAESCD